MANGFYRISITNLGSYNLASPVTVTYKENYFDYSLNKYDNAGNLIKNYQPLNKLESSFEYNSLGQLLYSNSPDEGESWFKYMHDGKIRYSQNSEQLLAGKFSYTNYDNIGRPIESGVINSNSFSTINPNNSLPTGLRSEQQFTVYDKLEQSDLNFLSGVNSTFANPSFLFGNVAKSKNNNVSSFYSYDVYGRVKWMVQNIVDLGAKTINYTYDAVTGAVTLVDYQKYSTGERFLHRYTYDIQGQLIKVETSTNATTFITQATYEYYESGALKRKVLGNGIQGMDYVYNLNGSLKSINNPGLTSIKDPGGDSNDLFGMTIHYNDQDYLRTNTPKTVDVTSLGTEQYNGNIKGIEWKTQGSTAANYFYEYDRNNWLTKADFNLGQGSSDYRVDNLTYDANGNIKSLRRNKNTQSGSNVMDNLTYRYKLGKNQLEYVDDAVTSTTNANDIKDQASNNYSYNKIGQLVSNIKDGITYTYNTSGLVSKVQIGANNVEFFYDDRGQRIKKVTTMNGIIATSFYVRDAAGNALSIYNGNNMEQTIFGSSRLGVAKRTIGQTSLAEQNYFYELTDHLGNVRAIVQKQTNGNILAIAKTDYYPFGMTMPGRDVQGDYRYAYQGQEKDSETEMEAFELRLWDSRIGRWLTTDSYGQYSSPYLGMNNNPISSIDPDGGFSWLGAQLFKLFNGGNISKVQVENGSYYKVTGFSDTGASIAVGGGAIRQAKRGYRFPVGGGAGLSLFNVRDRSYNDIPDVYFEANAAITSGSGGIDVRFIGTRLGLSGEFAKQSSHELGFKIDTSLDDFFINTSGIKGGLFKGDTWGFGAGAGVGADLQFDRRTGRLLEVTTNAVIVDYITEFNINGVHKGEILKRKMGVNIGLSAALFYGGEANIKAGIIFPSEK